jgi:hypothetical protein
MCRSPLDLAAEDAELPLRRLDTVLAVRIVNFHDFRTN